MSTTAPRKTSLVPSRLVGLGYTSSPSGSANPPAGSSTPPAAASAATATSSATASVKPKKSKKTPALPKEQQLKFNIAKLIPIISKKGKFVPLTAYDSFRKDVLKDDQDEYRDLTESVPQNQGVKVFRIFFMYAAFNKLVNKIHGFGNRLKRTLPQLNSSNIDDYYKNLTPEGNLAFVGGSDLSIKDLVEGSLKYLKRPKGTGFKVLAERAKKLLEKPQASSQQLKLGVALTCAIIAKSELLGLSKSWNRKTFESNEYDTRDIKYEALSKVKDLKERLQSEREQRMGRESIVKKIVAGREQNVQSNEEASGFKRDGTYVGSKYLFPAPQEPNTSIRAGQECIANVDRASGLVKANFKGKSIVVSLGLLLGFQPGSDEGQYILHREFTGLDDYEPKRKGKTLEKVIASVTRRENERQKSNLSAEEFAARIYQRRNKEYERSLKGGARNPQELKASVLETSTPYKVPRVKGSTSIRKRVAKSAKPSASSTSVSTSGYLTPPDDDNAPQATVSTSSPTRKRPADEDKNTKTKKQKVSGTGALIIQESVLKMLKDVVSAAPKLSSKVRTSKASAAVIKALKTNQQAYEVYSNLSPTHKQKLVKKLKQFIIEK